MKSPSALIIVYRYLCVLLLILSLGNGCSLVPKNSEGYYSEHYYACGPTALKEALSLFSAKHEHKLVASENISRIEISKLIQDNSFACQEFLSVLNEKALQITWPAQIIDVVGVDSLKELDPDVDIAVVLIHNGLTNYHWLCFPANRNIDKHWGDSTVVDKIYVLKGAQ